MKISVLITERLLGRVSCSEAGNEGCRTGDMPGFAMGLSPFVFNLHFASVSKGNKVEKPSCP